MAFAVTAAMAALLAAAVASVAGFGIGSILTPVVALWMPAKTAIAAVAFPHAAATLLRFWMLRRAPDLRVLLHFGVLSAAGGFCGALLHAEAGSPALAVVFAAVLLFAGLASITGLSRKMRFGRKAAWAAGAVSGMLGGMVGNQGGIRAAALMGFHLEPRPFVATATAIALIVDAVRIPVYLATERDALAGLWPVVAATTVAGLAGRSSASGCCGEFRNPPSGGSLAVCWWPWRSGCFEGRRDPVRDEARDTLGQVAGAALTQSLKTVAELAASGGVRDVLAWISEEKKWINDRHLEVSRIAAPTFQERERAEWMAARFRAMGCQSRLDRAGNVIAYLNGPGAGPLVALTAHLDTVLAPRVPEEIQYGRDGTLYGPGVADNGAGLAALLAVAQAIRSAPRLAENSLPLVFIANVGEEGEGNLSGMRYLCRPSGLASRIRAFVVLDGPSTDHITCRALASRRFEVTLAGPGGHSWSDYGVGNPVHALGRAIALFSEHQTVLGNAMPRASFNFGTIEGGTSVNSIPTTARAKLDIRSESPEKIEELAALLTASVERAIETENDRAAGGRVTAKIREIGSRPGGQLAEDAAILTHVRAVDRHLRIRSSADCASTDANIPLSLGMQAISIGAGGQGGGAHTPGEWYHPEGREVGLQRILLTLFLLMREIDPEAGR